MIDPTNFGDIILLRIARVTITTKCSFFFLSSVSSLFRSSESSPLRQLNYFERESIVLKWCMNEYYHN
jgi:hypothetical protein